MKFKFKKIPYFIAEVGVNHENNINLAEKIIKQASIGGASAVKFQTYKAELLAGIKIKFAINHSMSYSKSLINLMRMII